MKRMIVALVGACIVAGTLGPGRASAGGLYLTDRGTRQLGRGGAFAAGTDDGHSLWYNPAGLAYTGRGQLHVDGTLALFRGSFKRATRDDVNAPTSRVDASPAKLPIPLLAYSGNFGLRQFSFGIALMAPNAVMLAWPEYVDGPGGMRVPSPTRHSLVSMKGSAIAHLGVGVAWHGWKGLSIGAGVHAIASRFRAGVYLSACDYGVLCRQPENPDWETPATINLDRALTATGIVGAIYRWDRVRVGASIMLPHTIEGRAKLKAELPSAPLFGPSDCGDRESRETRPECAKIRGDRADLSLDMPMVARVGVEVQPVQALRAEVGVVYEGWSRQTDLRVTPKDIRIVDALAVSNYEVGPLAVKRDMRDVYSLRIGGEYSWSGRIPVMARAGAILENSALRNRTLTPLNLDSQKLLLGIGASCEVGRGVWLDAMYAHLFMANLTVRDSAVYPQNALRPPPASAANPQPDLARPEPVGNGAYTMDADLVGLGLRWNR